MIGTRLRLLVGADGLGELEPVHVGHLDVGQHHVEALARAQRGQALLRVRRGAHAVAGGLEHRRQHVAEEGASRPPAAPIARCAEGFISLRVNQSANAIGRKWPTSITSVAWPLITAEPRMPACAPATSMLSRSSTMSMISSTTRPMERPSSANTRIGCAPWSAMVDARPSAPAASAARGTAPCGGR